ncbi:MAG: cation transporter [Deltaproteobacteria bacterium]|nr:cation transporter [Deltaproteobacteria bacterium]
MSGFAKPESNNAASGHRQRVVVATLSIVAGTLILALKFLAFRISGSAALMSDAMESAVNVVAAVFALWAIVFAGQPADREHPYGHGKMEFFSAAFEGGLISLAAVLILYEAARTFIEGPHLTNLSGGLALNLGGGALNGLLGFFLVRKGKTLRSKAIEADGHHILSDFYTTLGVVGGLLLVKLTGAVWLDPVLALAVGILLAVTGFKLVKQSAGALLDTQDPTLLQRLIQALNRGRVSGIIFIQRLRVMRSGRHAHVDVQVTVPEFFEVGKAHDLVESYGDRVIGEMDLDGEFHAHIEPCRQAYCARCEVEPCPIRKAEFSRAREITLEDAASGYECY